MPTHRYEIVVHCIGLRSKVTFNGCSVFRTWTPDERGIRQNLAPWTLDSATNRIEVGLQPFADLPDDVEPAFWLTLHKPSKADSCNDVNRLLKYQWMTNEGALSPGAPRVVLSHPFHVGAAFGRWEWERARAYDQHRDRRGVEDLVARMHKALEDRDVPTLNALLGIKLSELGHALGIPLEQMELEQAKYFEMHFEDDAWTVAPLDLPSLVLEPDAGGRLVHVLGPAQAPPLVGFGGGRPFAFPLTVSNIDDSWLIVR